LSYGMKKCRLRIISLIPWFKTILLKPSARLAAYRT
jgi:hypothetical protein